MKMIIILLVALMFVPIVMAQCTQVSNVFDSGEDINICLNNCTYPNSNDATQQLSCDAEVICVVSAYDNNGNQLVSRVVSQRTGSEYNYSLGNLTWEGTGKAEFCCYSYKGSKCTEGNFIINPPNLNQQSGSASGFVQKDQLEGEVMSIINKNIGNIAERLNKSAARYWPIVLGGILIVVIAKSNRNKKKQRKMQENQQRDKQNLDRDLRRREDKLKKQMRREDEEYFG